MLRLYYNHERKGYASSDNALLLLLLERLKQEAERCVLFTLRCEVTVTKMADSDRTKRRHT
jgi:hypothetical protein